MQYTLKTAMKALAESSGAYGQSNLRESINRAIQNLSNMAGWEQLRKVLRFTCTGPRFVLPQGCAGLVRACLNGRPSTVRAQDFKFIHSGPGDMKHPPAGFCPLKAANIVDLGSMPVMVEPDSPFRLLASSGAEASLAVRGVTPDGELRSAVVAAAQDPEQATPTEAEFAHVTEVAVVSATDYVTLYADSGARTEMAVYNPEVEAPEFRHYEISGVRPGQRVELLVEARIDPMPLVRDTDVLPFPSLNPVEWMIRGDWMMKAGEIDAAQKYYGQAASWLKALEVTRDTVQTSLVVNSVFENSMGQLSAESVNI